MSVRNLQFCNGILSYKRYIIEENTGIGEECYGQYIWSEYTAHQFGCSEQTVGGTLEDILVAIDLKLGECYE